MAAIGAQCGATEGTHICLWPSHLDPSLGSLFVHLVHGNPLGDALPLEVLQKQKKKQSPGFLRAHWAGLGKKELLKHPIHSLVPAGWALPGSRRLANVAS